MVSNIDDYTDVRKNSSIVSFYNVLREATPAFIFEDLPHYKSDNIDEFYKYIGYFLDILYDKIRNLPNELTVNDNSGPFLFELAEEIGLTDFLELSKYLNEDGTINTTLISEYDYNLYVINQKTKLKSALSSYLSKGTLKNIQNVFSTFGAEITIEEMWRVESSEVFDIPDVFDANVFSITGATLPESFLSTSNSLITKYRDAQVALASAYYPENYNLGSEVIANAPELSGGNFNLIDFKNNFKDYKYILTNSLINGVSGYYLYYKTNEEPQSNLVNASTWYSFTGVHQTSGITVDNIKLTDSYIFIKYTNNNLDVYDNTLETNTIRFSIDDNNCLFFYPIEDLNLLIIDRGNIIEIRELDNFFPRYKLNKPNSTTIRYVLNCDFNNYLAINTNNECYLLKDLSLIEPSIDSAITPTISAGGEIVCAYTESKNDIVIFANSSSNINKCIVNTQYPNQIYTNESILISASGMQLLDSEKFYEKILLLMDNNKIYFYSTDKFTVTNFDALDPQTGFTNVFLTDKFYLYRNAQPTLLQKIVGFNIGVNSIYKLHYFNVSALNTTTSLIYLKNSTDVGNLLKILKPAHTELVTVTMYYDFGQFGLDFYGDGYFGRGNF